MKTTAYEKSNRLARETSPYLLQHAHNPVDWYPWGAEAIERARAEDRPLLVSVGYSSCHWCHVMERESFSNPSIAQLMNENFICVKVDREERPDVDHTLMTAAQMIRGGGGWPLTVFLTPGLKPFYAGTYFPPEDRYGIVGFPTLLRHIARLYREQRDEIENAGTQLLTHLQSDPSNLRESHDIARLDLPRLQDACARLLSTVDPVHGGFGRAPKFPQAPSLLFLLEEYRREPEPAALEAIERTLDGMARGGIHDHLAGGFHRYSTDEEWLVPHFEKMLYDNALLAMVYARAWQITGHERFGATARSTLDFLLAEMRDPSGGFYAAYDADSEGAEGKYYVWSFRQIEEALGREAARRFGRAYGVTEAGHFEEGKNIPHRAGPWQEIAQDEGMSVADLEQDLSRSRARLLEVRRQRVAPFLDRKVLTAWNGMAISALAEAAMLLDKPRYGRAAGQTADWILNHHRTADGELAHSSAGGHASGGAFLDDYAWLALGLLDLYHATLEERWLFEAEALARRALDRLADPSGGALLFAAVPTSPSLELPVRARKLMDEAVPSPNAVMWEVFRRLDALQGGEQFQSAAGREERALAAVCAQYAGAVSHYALAVAGMSLNPPAQVVIIGPRDSAAPLLREAQRRWAPGMALLWADAASAGGWVRGFSALFDGKTARNGFAAAYVCRGATCLPPVDSAQGVAQLLTR